MLAASHKQDLSIPFDMAGVEANPHWRDELAWPVSPLNLGETYRQILSDYLALVRTLSSDEQRIAILAMAPAIGVAAPAFEIAQYVDAEAKTGVRVLGQKPEFKYLRGDSKQVPSPRMRGFTDTIAAPRMPLRRNTQVTRWWTSWQRMAPTMLRPDAVAVAENELLIASARVSPEKIAFRHGGLYIRAARKRNVAASEGLAALSAKIIKTVMACLEVDEEICERVEALLTVNCLPLLTRVSSDLNGLGQAKDLPQKIWSGTAGNYTTRAIGLEVMRRDGSVTRFEHGGTNGMMNYPEVSALLELLATTTLVLPSEKLAENVRSSGATALLPANQNVKVIGHDAILPLPKHRPFDPTNRSHRKVVYCPTLLLGSRRHAFSTLPDPLSLDWTLRITEALLDMPITLLCKPHPEGVFQGRDHPVSKIAATSYRRFEDEIDDADLFIFDRCHSTAFWVALSTDRPVVYLEATPPALHPAIRGAMERRCRILQATFDDRNRPQIDAVAFRDAVVGGEANVDPAEAQEILLGRSA